MEQKPDLDRILSFLVQEATQSGDFSKVKDAVKDTLKTAVDITTECAKSLREEVGAQWPSSTPTKPVSPGTGSSPGGQASAQPGQRNARPVYPSPPVYQPVAKQEEKSVYAPAPPVYLKRRRKDVVLGFLTAVVGGVLGIPALMWALLCGVELMILGVHGFFVTAGIAALVLGVFGLVLMGRGCARFGRARRFRLYWMQLKDKGLASIDVLAGAVRKKPSFVVRDINYMLKAGLFPQGHMDQEKTCLMLGQGLYQQYLAAREGKKQREEDHSGRNEVIAAGVEAVTQIRQVSQSLPGSPIGGKLLRLEEAVTNIFAYVENKPEKLPSIRRFTSYYLPTTLKLVKSYEAFEKQPQTPSVTKAKEEILATLDVINQAFEQLLEEWYQEEHLDISTDISALKTMLAQEGLTGGDFPR